MNTNTDQPKELTTKEQRFIEEYAATPCASKAAKAAGYSQKTAAEIGYQLLRKPHIKTAISARLADLSLGPKETTKLISDIARSSLNDYFTVKQVIRRPEVKRHLSLLIQDVHAQIEDADKFIVRAKIEEPEALEKHNAAQHSKRLEILRYEIELERNPQAFRVVAGEPVVSEEVELDMVKLVQDKQGGRIKSIKHSEYGLNVEMYAADAALRDVARIHGLFEKDNEQAKPAPIFKTEIKIIPSDVPIVSDEKDVVL